MKRALITILTWSILWTGPIGASDDAVAPELAMPLFLKILTYDQSFKFDKDKTVDLYLPYDKSNAVSYEQFLSVQDYFHKNSGITVFGATIRFLPLCCDSISSKLSEIDHDHYSLVVLTSMSPDKIRQYLDDERIQGVRTYALDPDLMTLGASVGVKATKSKTEIIVNLAKAEQEGTRFGAQFLRICDVIEEQP